jgi:hypothetical protein
LANFRETVGKKLSGLTQKIDEISKKQTDEYLQLHPYVLNKYIEKAEKLGNDFFKDRKDIAHSAMLKARKELNKIEAMQNAASRTASPTETPPSTPEISRGSQSSIAEEIPEESHFHYDESPIFAVHIPTFFPGVELDDDSYTKVLEGLEYVYEMERNRSPLKTKGEELTKGEKSQLPDVEAHQTFQRGKFIDQIQEVVDRYYPDPTKNREVIENIRESLKFLQMAWTNETA